MCMCVSALDTTERRTQVSLRRGRLGKNLLEQRKRALQTPKERTFQENGTASPRTLTMAEIPVGRAVTT